MPKKLSTNSKAAEARARKDAVKNAEKEKVEKAKEDALWADNDRQLAKKQQRKEEKERKEQEERERKKEREKLLEEEMSSIKGKTAPQNIKVTRAQVEKNIEEMKIAQQAKVKEIALEENLNRVIDVNDSAHNVDAAIDLMANLSTQGGDIVDKHPEKRLKAAWEAFEAERLPILKAENPNLRLSQLRQMIRKEWQKSPENPLNQRHIAYNVKSQPNVDLAVDE